MMYVLCFPVRKYCGDEQTWTWTSLICCSSSTLNNPPSVFLGEKSCNQILIPEAQTRCWKLKYFFSLSSVPPSPSPPWWDCFKLLLFSLSLLSSCHPPSLHLVVGGVRCQETREIDLEPRATAHLKAPGLFSQLHAGREGGRCWNGKKGNEEGERGNGETVVLGWKRGPGSH